MYFLMRAELVRNLNPDGGEIRDVWECVIRVWGGVEERKREVYFGKNLNVRLLLFGSRFI